MIEYFFDGLKIRVPTNMHEMARERGPPQIPVGARQFQTVALPAGLTAVVIARDARRAEHGGQPTGDGSLVHHMKCHRQRKSRGWARIDFLLQIIRVDVDEPRDEEPPGEIQPFRIPPPRPDLRDTAAFDYNRPVNGSLGQYQECIREDLTAHELLEFGLLGEQALPDQIRDALSEVDHHHDKDEAGEHVLVA